MKIDVCLVAGSRPELLQTTLTSFREKLFRNFDVARLIVNIDPIFGPERDREECTAILRAFFPSSEISCPEAANFCSAVRTVWQSSSADFILHMEDDWVLERDVSTDLMRETFSEAPVAQVSFNCKEKNWDTGKKGSYHYAKKNYEFMGLKLPVSRRVPRFTTSPSFLRGDFARRCAALMDPGFDPEKQFYSSVNAGLESFVSAYRNFVIGSGPEFWIRDIGRDWRNERGIQKKNIESRSVWTGGSVSAQD
jgi:hypothetical protein